ncbi:MAG: hypothetical protein WD749_14535, partial [Phycisphaerales bacterium]
MGHDGPADGPGPVDPRGEATTGSAAGGAAAAGPGGAGVGGAGGAGALPTLVVGVPGERAGDRIGPYRLLEPLGEGGFGVVWLAERREPFTQRVALKVIKPGMDSRA